MSVSKRPRLTEIRLRIETGSGIRYVTFCRDDVVPWQVSSARDENCDAMEGERMLAAARAAVALLNRDALWPAVKKR